MGVSDTKRSVRAAPLRTGSASSTILSFFARLVAWYLLYTVLFRCPEVPTNDSPTICHTANTVSTTLRPHLEPYYTQYIEPYVSEYAPYAKKANEEYLAPVYGGAQILYAQYAGPHVSSNRDYVLREYSRVVKPRVDEVSSKAKVYYTEYLSPHVAKGEEFYTSAQPHINYAQKTVEGAYKDILVPAYEKALPHVVKAYEQTKHVVVTVVAPMVRQNGEKAVYWGIGIWSDVVRPQVGRIGERLGGTGNGTPAAPVGSPLSSLSATDASEATAASSIITSTSAEESASVVSQAEEGSHNTDADGAKKLTPEEAAMIIDADLASWAGKFQETQAKSIDDLNAEISWISIEAFDKKSSYVEKEIAALEKLVDVEFKNIKKTTTKIASGLSSESGIEEKKAALDSLFGATRDAGISIRDKAQEQRLESQKYLAAIYDDVTEAADHFLEVFDLLLDQCMQELGMKWAWMDHVGYKAWRRYHAIKEDFEGLKRGIFAAAQRNQELIDVTRWVEGDWEGKATNIAKDAAEELQRLKRVSKKKIELADSSDDFSDSIISAPVGKAEQQVLEKVEEVKASRGEPVGKATEDVAEKVSANVIDTDSAEKIYDTEYEVILEATLETEEPTPLAASTSSIATGTVKVHVPGGVNAGFVGASRVEYELDPEGETITEVVQDVIDTASESAVLGIPTAGSILYEALGPRAKLFASLASEAYDRAVTSAGDRYRKAMRNVATMVYPDELPHQPAAKNAAVEAYDEELDAAEDLYSNWLNQASSAQQQYDRISQEAQEIYQAAVDAASTAVYGTSQPAVESLISVASEQYQQVLRAAEETYDIWYNYASKVVSPPSTSAFVVTMTKLGESTSSAAPGAAYGTVQSLTKSIGSAARGYAAAATGTAEKPMKEFVSVASAVASAATDAVEVRYESVKAFVSELVSGKEPAFTESAISRLSSLMYGTEAPLVAKATSAIGEAYDSVSSVVAGNYESANNAVGGAPEKVKEVYSTMRDEL